MNLPVLSTERTIFQKSVKDVPTKGQKYGLLVLKEAAANKKVGAGSNIMNKGMKSMRGSPVFTLTLEEGATCPSTCPNLVKRGDGGKKMVCYGSNMPFAHRYRHGPALTGALREDLERLHNKFPNGFVVRLHILGDFYSEDYVDFWAEMCNTFDSLRIYGYTHHRYGTPIGNKVALLVEQFKDRVCILRSDGDHANDPLRRAITILHGAAVPDGAVVCPNQTHGVACVDCGLCMTNNIRTPIAFLQH